MCIRTFIFPWPTSTGCPTRLGNAHRRTCLAIRVTWHHPSQVPRYQPSTPTTQRPTGKTQHQRQCLCCSPGEEERHLTHSPPTRARRQIPWQTRAITAVVGQPQQAVSQSRHDMYHVATSRGAETSSSHAPCASTMEGEWNGPRTTVSNRPVTMKVCEMEAVNGLRRVVACGHPPDKSRQRLELVSTSDMTGQKPQGRVHREWAGPRGGSSGPDLQTAAGAVLHLPLGGGNNHHTTDGKLP